MAKKKKIIFQHIFSKNIEPILNKNKIMYLCFTHKTPENK